MCCIYSAENCKIHFKIIGQIIFIKKNDVTADVAQRESSSIKCYASAFSNIFFLFWFFKLKRLTQNPKTELKMLWIGLDCGTK